MKVLDCITDIGQWVNDKRNGKGYERYKNGNTYEGDFKDGKAHGGGIFQWSTGETYDGYRQIYIWLLSTLHF